jgi:AhpD family alkylhydroperoxidase
MATVKLIQNEDITPSVQAVFDDIKTTRQTDYINNFWRALANQPNNLKRVWEDTKTIMANGEIDSLTKEMVYMAVSIVNNCDYCIHTHTASATNKGMTEGQYQELLAVIGLAMQNNGFATGMKVPVDKRFLMSDEF